MSTFFNKRTFQKRAFLIRDINHLNIWITFLNMGGHLFLKQGAIIAYSISKQRSEQYHADELTFAQFALIDLNTDQNCLSVFNTHNYCNATKRTSVYLN